MLVFEKKLDLQAYLRIIKCSGKIIGFVPTMGALHEGHIRLIDHSKKNSDFTVCSIFVNPTQFNNKKDLEKYPRTLEADIKLLEEAGCDVLFCPDVAEMYPTEKMISFNFGALETIMEGKYRPGHFDGVGLVVSKLFNIVQPDKAFFGQKDLQQCRVIQQLVNQLSFNVAIECVPTVREADGLAMSSRNRRLSEEERLLATSLFRALKLAEKEVIEHGNLIETNKKIEAFFQSIPEFILEYFAIVDGGTLQEVNNVHEHEQIALCIAGYLGEVRLIDNLLINLNH